MITASNWRKYIDKLAAIDKKAADLVQAYIDQNGLQDTEALIQYAYAVVTKYGEASATLASEMYDYMADLMDADVPEAIPAETASLKEVAKGVTWGKYHSPSQIPSVIGRQVRQAGADTMIQNARRDNAQWAWVPQGDTCAFCITLASRGWQDASKTVLKGNHAEHIHQNCDCTFAIAFKPSDKKQYDAVYDPEKYEEMYYGAEGDTPTEKMSSLRRRIYSKKRDTEQLKALEEQSRNKPGSNERTVISPIIQTKEYEKRLESIDEDRRITSRVLHEARTTLYRRNGTLMEDMTYVSSITGQYLSQRNYDKEGEVMPTDKMKEMLLQSPPRSIIGIHNHPRNMMPSYMDLLAAKNYKYGVILCHNGNVLKYTVSEDADITAADYILNYVQKDFDSGNPINEHLRLLQQAGVTLEVIS